MVTYYNRKDQVIEQHPLTRMIRPFNYADKYVIYDEGMSDPETEQLIQIRTDNPDYDAVKVLADEKVSRSGEVRKKTSDLILAGFISAVKTDKHFGSTMTDQANWTSLVVSLDALTFPVYIQDINGIPVSFANKTEVQQVFAEGFTRKATLLAQDGVLEQRIAGAETLTDLDLIVDDRV